MKKTHITIVMCAVCLLTNFMAIHAQKSRTIRATSETQLSTTWNGTGWTNGKPNKLTKAIFAQDFKATENIVALDVEVLKGAKVTIEDNVSLNVLNILKVDPQGKLTLVENAQLLQKNPSSPNTVIDVTRTTGYINKFDYTYFSSPVENQQLNLIGDPAFFGYYNNSNGPGGFTYLPPISDRYYVFESNAAASGTDVNMFNTGAWTSIPETTIMNTPGKGFIIRGPNSFPSVAPTQQWQVKFTGEPYTGTKTREIYGIPYTPFNGALTPLGSPVSYPYRPCENTLYTLNLIGNPYPAIMSSDAFLSLPANITNLDGAMYFWTHKNGPTSSNGGNGTELLNYTNNDYVVYNLVGGVGGVNRPTGIIPTCQGFVIRGLTNSVATFTDDMKNITGTDQMYRLNNSALTTPVTKNRFWVSMEGGSSNAYRETLIGYMPPATTANDNILSSIPGSTNNYEKMYDVEIFKAVYNTYSNGSNDLTNRFELYTLLNPTTPCPRLVIQGRKLDATFNVNDVVQLGYTCPAGTYTIKGFNSEGLFSSQQYWLKETVGGVSTYHDIRNTPYTFTETAAINDNSTRFQIVFKLPNLTSISSPPVCGTTLSSIWTTLFSTQIAGATSYKYQVATDPSFSAGTIVGLYDGNISPFFRPYQFYLNIAGQIIYNTTYYIRVATYQVNNEWVFGPICAVTTHPPPTSKLTDTVGTSIGSCGSTIDNYNNTLYCYSPSELGFSTSGYRFQVSTSSTFASGTIVGLIETTVNRFSLAQLRPAYNPQQNTVYYVRVQIRYNNSGTPTWQVDAGGNPIYGVICTVTTTATATGRLAASSLSIFEAKAYPNPFANNFKLEINSSSEELIELKVFDMIGREIESRLVSISDFDTQGLGENYTSGVYNVIVKQGDNIKTLRIIKR